MAQNVYLKYPNHPFVNTKFFKCKSYLFDVNQKQNIVKFFTGQNITLKIRPFTQQHFDDKG